MSRKKTPSPAPIATEIVGPDYEQLLAGMVELLDSARRIAARSVNTVMTSTYWDMGRRIVELEQKGRGRAAYGERLIEQLSRDLTGRFGRGFGVVNLTQMRRFYQLWPGLEILQTASEVLGRAGSGEGLHRFPLAWSHYVQLMSVDDPRAREFYEAEALRGGWSVRQLGRQVGTQFYERTLLSRDKSAMLRKGKQARPEDAVTPEQEIKDPFVLEFLALKDEYSESDLEEALIRHLESFLLELGDDFTFVGRQRRMRVDDQWFRVDLVFFHRVLRCLVIIDLKLDELTPGDVGQMNLYLNYARHHWTRDGENPPVGLILCAKHKSGVAKYALEGMTNKILASRYRTTLPSEETLTTELENTRKLFESRLKLKSRKPKT